MSNRHTDASDTRSIESCSDTCVEIGTEIKERGSGVSV